MIKQFTEQSRLAAGDICVFFVHGYLSSPQFFDKLIERLPEKINYLNILLPGHGSTMQEFSQVSMFDWESCVQSKLQQLRQQYKKIIVVGHSLGTLLLIEELMRNCEQVVNSIYIDVPLVGRITVSGIEVMLKSALNVENSEQNEALKAANYAKSIEVAGVRDLPLVIPSLIALLLKMRSIRNKFAAYPLESTIFQSQDDELVSAISNKYISQNPLAKLCIMTESGHFAFSERENQAICDAIVAAYNKAEANVTRE